MHLWSITCTLAAHRGTIPQQSVLLLQCMRCLHWTVQALSYLLHSSDDTAPSRRGHPCIARAPKTLPLPSRQLQDAPPRARHLAAQVQRLIRGQRAPRSVRARDERLEANAAPRRAHQHRVAAGRALRRGRLAALHLDAGAHLRGRRALASNPFVSCRAVECLVHQ